jgi:zinc protease
MFAKFILRVVLFAAFFTGTAFAAPDIQHWTTANGVRVYFVQADELPMLDVRVVFDAGSARDGEKSGLATLTNGLLAEGAAGLDAKQLAEQFENVGAGFGNSVAQDNAFLSLRSLRDDKYLQPALATFKQILTQPDFPADAFERERKRLLIAIKAKQQSPGDIAQDAFYKAIYGNHPYASPVEGTETGVGALKRTDLNAFYKKYYVAKNAIVVMVGQLDRVTAEKLAADLTANLAVGEQAPALPPVPELTASKTLHIDYASQQSHVLVGQPGTKRLDADALTLYVANHSLGGSGFASRLMDEVREKRGLAYSVYSYFMPLREIGPFQMGLQTRSDQTGEALAILRSTLQDYVQTGPTDKELTAALSNITGGFPLRIDSNSKLTEYVAMIGFYGLPLDYLDTFTQRVNTVTAEKIRDALQRRVQPDKMVTVIVGPSQNGATLGANQ